MLAVPEATGQLTQDGLANYYWVPLRSKKTCQSSTHDQLNTHERGNSK
jgi:hypothetical protein